MTIAETTDTLCNLLTAMYTNPRLNPLPLSPKYNYVALEAALVEMVKMHNKEILSTDGFPWPVGGKNEDALCQT
jgi:hypothetical protein